MSSVISARASRRRTDHPIYGTGTVVSVSGNDINKILETEFYSVGIKRLTAKWVSENC